MGRKRRESRSRGVALTDACSPALEGSIRGRREDDGRPVRANEALNYVAECHGRGSLKTDVLSDVRYYYVFSI